MAGSSMAGTVYLEEGWNLKGSSCSMNVPAVFDKPGIVTVWKWKDDKWQVWSPDESLMEIIEKYVAQGSVEILENIEPYDGFWINTNQPVYVDFCDVVSVPSNESPVEEDENFKNLLLANLSNFLKIANGQTVTIFEGDEVTCKFVYDGNSTLSLVDCSDPDNDGNLTIDWDKLEIISDSNADEIVWADNNTLCVNYEKDGIYRTSCAVINVPQPTDDEILTGLTQGSRVPFWYNPEIADWEPVGVCLTYYDNGTVVYKDENNNVVDVCNYVVDNGTVVITCDTDNGTIVKKAKAISPFTISEENATGNIINIKFYAPDGTLGKWTNVISIKVENCEDFWTEYGEEEEAPQDYSNVISGKVTFYNGTLSDDLKIRITPDVEQVDGDWGGIVCQINSDGTFGDKCVLHGDINNYNDQHQFQVVIFYDENDDWHWESTEPSVDVIEDVPFGSWENIEF
jgi:hypothetical protein